MKPVLRAKRTRGTRSPLYSVARSSRRAKPKSDSTRSCRSSPTSETSTPRPNQANDGCSTGRCSTASPYKTTTPQPSHPSRPSPRSSPAIPAPTTNKPCPALMRGRVRTFDFTWDCSPRMQTNCGKPTITSRPSQSASFLRRTVDVGARHSRDSRPRRSARSSPPMGRGRPSTNLPPSTAAIASRSAPS